MRAEVAWFRIDEGTSSWRALQNIWISHAESIYYDVSLARWQAQDLNSTLASSIQVLERAGIPASHALACWTTVVEVDVDRTTQKDNLSAFVVRDRIGQEIGQVNLTAEWRESRPDRLPFILVARNLRWSKPFLDLMCVEWVDGIAFRVQVIRNATVTDEVWTTLRPEWRLVTLA